MVFQVLAPKAKEEISIIFAAACTWRKYQDPCALGAHTPVRGLVGDLKGGGDEVPLFIYTSFAVFIFTPGPMVDAATQLRIYWPLAVAGLALTMAPIRAL